MSVVKSFDELFNQFIEQIQFIIRSSRAYDEGYEDEAIRLAQSIRILLHETRRSTSLFSIIGLYDINIHNTCANMNPVNMWPETPLLLLTTDEKLGFKYISPLGMALPPGTVTDKLTSWKSLTAM